MQKIFVGCQFGKKMTLDQNGVVLALQFLFFKFCLQQNGIVLDKKGPKRRRFEAELTYPKRRRFELVGAASKRRRFGPVSLQNDVVLLFI